MLFADFPLPNIYNYLTQQIVAFLFLATFLILFVVCLINRRNKEKYSALLKIFILTIFTCPLMGSVFYDHYYQQYLGTEFGDEISRRNHEIIFHIYKEMYAVITLIGILLAIVLVGTEYYAARKSSA